MGLADKDYMEDREERDYPGPWGPADLSVTYTLWLVLASCAIAYTAYKAWDWWVDTHSKRIAPVATAAPAFRSPVTHPSLTEKPQSNRTVVNAASTATGTVVIKCVVNGKTAYVASEADCAAQAKTTKVSVDPRQNLSDGLPNAEQVIRRPSISGQVEMQIAEPDPNVQRRARCQAYEQEIKLIDERARQPLSGQEQDWLAAKRKKARDEQFRLHC
ncbi:MAG: hypothetical protein K0Q43_283 [Ramlibacter sp.]|jgi:hypothetical protein|nr:hypothetical protein [Ramlibacter sp.]